MLVEQWLNGVPLVANLPDATRQALVQRLMPRRFDKGTYLFREGEPGDWAYIVIEGQVRVARTTPDGDEFVLATWGPGQVVGLVAVSAGDPYAASALAVQPTQALAISRIELEGLTNQLPGLAVSVVREVSGRARDFATRLMQAEMLDVKGKLAALLLGLAGEGQRVGGGVLVASDLTHQDLGCMCASTRETVSRTLSAWRKAGWVERPRRGVVLLNQTALAKVAGQAE